MTAPREFTPPPQATRNCRHYSYNLGGRGSACALGIDLSTPGASNPCWGDADGGCNLREDYTAEERAAWREWVDGSIDRLGLAIGALPAPIPLGTTGKIACPNCGGDLHYSRWHRGASVQCATPHCCGARMSIEAGKDWPQPKAEGEA